MRGLGANPCLVHGGKRTPKKQTRPLGWELQTQKSSLKVKRSRLPRTVSFKSKKLRQFANESKASSGLGMTLFTAVKRG